jgi:hypothetical protein
MDMEFKLPSQSKIQKFVPKNIFFSKAVVNTKLKKEFTDKIQKITWKYKLAEDTIGIPKTESTQEIQIFEIQLKEQTIPKNVLKLIDRSIPYPILYVFVFETHIAYGITLKGDRRQNYYFSDWDEELAFDFFGITLEKVYQGIVRQFIRGMPEKKGDFAIIIETDRRKKALEKEMAALKNKVKNEKQFHKKVELHKVLQDKAKELESLIQLGF